MVIFFSYCIHYSNNDTASPIYKNPCNYTGPTGKFRTISRCQDQIISNLVLTTILILPCHVANHIHRLWGLVHELKSIWVFYGRCNKSPQTWWLKNNRNLFSPMSGGQIRNQAVMGCTPGGRVRESILYFFQVLLAAGLPGPLSTPFQYLPSSHSFLLFECQYHREYIWDLSW